MILSASQKPALTEVLGKFDAKEKRIHEIIRGFLHAVYPQQKDDQPEDETYSAPAWWLMDSLQELGFDITARNAGN